MRFAYIVFLALYSAIFFGTSVFLFVKLWQAKTKKDVAANLVLVIFILGLLAQFVADGIRVIGG
jgi:hypothetical protein